MTVRFIVDSNNWRLTNSLMYCKLFASLYQGTLRGRAHEILVFTNLLAHCDRDGFVDKHFKAISDEVGLSLDEVKAAIANLEAPDAESRSPEEGGARLVRMDAHRVWGWQVVNYVKYRTIRDSEDKREQNRKAQSKYRAVKAAEASAVVSRSKPPSAVVSRSKPQSAHAEGEATGSRQQGEAGTILAASGEPVVVTGAGIQSEPAVEPPTSPAAPAEAPNPAETPGDAKKSRKPYVGAKNGAAHAHFISEWCAAYENDRGDKYKVTGGMDGKAVKGLLAFDPDVDELIATAQAAWQKSGPKFWHCERAVTITYFAARLNEIRAELAAPESIASGSRQSGQPQSTPVLMGREMKL